MQLVDGRWRISGHDVEALSEQHGTPLYIYDSQVIRRQVNRFQEAFSSFDHRIYYAMKANSNPDLLRLMKELGLGIDAVSIYEIRIALDAGFEARDIIFTPNGVPFDELEQAIELGTRLNIENLSYLDQLGEAYRGDVPCTLRIHPGHVISTANHDTEGWYQRSRFGIDGDQIPEALRLIQMHQIRVEGLHVHSSSMILDEQVFGSAAEVLLNLARQLPDVRAIDLGGGIRPPYREQDDHPDLDLLSRSLTKPLDQFERDTGRKVQLWFEPGRYLVAECGTLLTRVHVLKQVGGRTVAGVDTGFHQLIRPKLYNAWHEIRNISNPEGSQHLIDISGCLCEEDDLARQRSLPEVREGHLLAILNAGAYGYSMASTYNSRPLPTEVVL
ncbi:MAG: diaminopimelate decarboxylase [Planctomycetes bacterium]|jgi:diaminopimelate decarboxylase|nr:diaminopimelate decarboxylase [Planctomycetota bacterium]MBT6453603.1 diaminopimelate decarboxylase [Planctomycetota bacterium]MBT6540595.1 diaminopimelate decarboxylase [Planctomycetota bacterium]MBT6783799.1 diaminopimelate decarboxylase [Planctomycetota bacterium]MBT6967921.1 diaminopimelate decarboxylase [Planctomycetota bacterium]